MRKALPALLGWLLLVAPAAVQAQYVYVETNGGITITGYFGPAGAVSIPATIKNLPVTSIGSNAFSGDTTVTSVTLPGSVINIADSAFSGCTILTNIEIPGSVTNIGAGAFSGTSLSSLDFHGQEFA